MHLRIRLAQPPKSQATGLEEFFTITKVLMTLLQNIIKDPLDEKYQKIKLNNKKIFQTISSNVECINLLEILGFQQFIDMISQSGGLEPYMIISKVDALENYQLI